MAFKIAFRLLDFRSPQIITHEFARMTQNHKRL